MHTQDYEALAREVRVLRRCAIGLGAVCVLLTAAGFAGRRSTDFEEINAQRINIVHADGRPALVIANNERLPGVLVRGVDKGGERDAAGMLFINAQGDEVGGLIYDTREEERGYQAGMNLTFDQYRQDQVVQLTYQDRPGHRAAGLMVTDRPTFGTVEDYVELRRRSESATGTERDSLRQDLARRAQAGEFWAQRAFIGSVNRSSYVMLKDTRGRTRLRMMVDSLDVPRIEILDASGAVVHRIPEAPPAPAR